MALLPKRKFPESRPLARVRNDVQGLVDEFVGRFPTLADDLGVSVSFPAVDVTETDAAVEVTAEVPGMTAENLDVSVTEDSLVLRGEKKEVTEEKGKVAHRIERRYGWFERTVPLPAEVDPAKVSAECKEGILHVTLPKRPAAEAKRKKIEVR